MNFMKLLTLFQKYDRLLENAGHRSLKSNTSIIVTPAAQLAHARWMCDEMMHTFDDSIAFKEKAMRWLGFIQGVLWANGVLTVDQMKDDNRTHGGAQEIQRPILSIVS